jgi:hypothetical protein
MHPLAVAGVLFVNEQAVAVLPHLAARQRNRIVVAVTGKPLGKRLQWLRPRQLAKGGAP